MTDEKLIHDFELQSDNGQCYDLDDPLDEFAGLTVSDVFRLPLNTNLIEQINPDLIQPAFDDGVTPFDFIEYVLMERDGLIEALSEAEQQLFDLKHRTNKSE